MEFVERTARTQVLSGPLFGDKKLQKWREIRVDLICTIPTVMCFSLLIENSDQIGPLHQRHRRFNTVRFFLFYLFPISGITAEVESWTGIA